MIFRKNLALLLVIGSMGIAVAKQDATNDRALESEPFICSEALDCRDCVWEGCAWAQDECMNSCNEIADASCYSKEFFPRLNPRQICRQDWTEKRDWEACSPAEDCSTCTSTPLYGGNGNCFWHDDVKACKPLLADAWSVGTDTCFSGRLDQCSNAGTSCNSCIDNGCAWTVGDCVPSCDVIADAECWAKETFPSLATTSICKLAKVEDDDEHICGMQTSHGCVQCVETLMFDGVNSCQWYSDPETGYGWCGTGGCDMEGNCGSAMCPVEYVSVTLDPVEYVTVTLDAKSAGEKPAKVASGSTQKSVSSMISKEDGHCGQMNNCLSCLNNENYCAWIGDSCQESCDAVADAACYSEATFPNLEGEEICAKAASTPEETIEPTEEVTPCGSMTNCLLCLEHNCAWIVDSCHVSCDVIQDANCYAELTFPKLEEQQICRIAEEDATNAQLCSNSTTCEDCTKTKKLDGSSCSWFTAEYDSSETWCSDEEGCDMWGNCGSATCEAPAAAAGGVRGGNQQKSHRGFFDRLGFP